MERCAVRSNPLPEKESHAVLEETLSETKRLLFLCGKAKEILASDCLTAEAADAFLDCVYLYGAERVEVVFSFEDSLSAIVRTFDLK